MVPIYRGKHFEVGNTAVRNWRVPESKENQKQQTATQVKLKSGNVNAGHSPPTIFRQAFGCGCGDDGLGIGKKHGDRCRTSLWREGFEYCLPVLIGSLAGPLQPYTFLIDTGPDPRVPPIRRAWRWFVGCARGEVA